MSEDVLAKVRAKYIRKKQKLGVTTKKIRFFTHSTLVTTIKTQEQIERKKTKEKSDCQYKPPSGHYYCNESLWGKFIRR